MEHKLLGACAQSRENWALISSIVKEGELSPEGSIIFGLISQFYEADPNASKADVEILQARANREIASNKASDIIVAGIKKLHEVEVSGVNVAKEALALRAHGVGLKIASQLASGKQPTALLREQIGEYLDLVSKEDVLLESSDEEIACLSASELTKRSFDPKGLIHVWPESLNKQLDGGIRGGHHLLIFAPTEMGKTLFVVNAAAGFLRQGLKVLYVGNEDPAADILMRMMNRITGMNKYEIIENPNKADALLERRNWDRFIFANLSPGTFNRIRGLVEKHKPDVLILDQLRNIDVSSENRTQALEKAATEARNTAKRYGIPVLSVTQAADSASGKTLLQRGDVDSSNVGIPGQCDTMIGIGATEDMEQQNIRVLSFPKNKISGKHGQLTVSIDPLLSKVIDT